ncbi:hypothetical protein C8J57DRAFT_1065834 [Mycena rebaudengoi]|nr:hypothetical protein C8J57DRAFT_1065834 [Mycena rebaudengoi]
MISLASDIPLPPGPSNFTFRAYADPTLQAPPRGSFQHDLASSNFQKSWKNWADFQSWRAQEQQKLCIELRLIHTHARMPAYIRKLRYVCSRAGTGRVKEYTKLHPDWARKLPTKKTDCECSLVVKQYPGTETILGAYSEEHNHPLGNANLRFTQIPEETREYIAGLLRLKVAPEHIASFKPVFLWLLALMSSYSCI